MSQTDDSSLQEHTTVRPRRPPILTFGITALTAILDQCAVNQFHRLDGMDDLWAKEFGLNYAQMRYVQDAVPGNEEAGFRRHSSVSTESGAGFGSKQWPKKSR